MSAAATIQRHRSLADIVREKTNDGETIVQFYLDVASGELDGFRDNHRMAAANKIAGFAPKLVEKYLLKYRNSDCRDSLRGEFLLPVRRPPFKSASPEGKTAPRGPNLLRRRLARIVREETGDGRAIVVFLEGVMHGLLTGFKPYHRLEAADKLAAYLTAKPDPIDAEPVPSAGEGPARTIRAETAEDSQLETLPGPALGADEEPVERVAGTSQSARPGVPPAPVDAETTEDSQLETDNSELETLPGPALGTAEEPVERVAGTSQSARPGVSPAPVDAETARDSQLETRDPKLETIPVRNFPPMTLEEIKRFDYDEGHFARYMFARDDYTGGIYAFDEIGPMVVDEDGNNLRISPDKIIGCERVLHAYRNRARWPDDVPKPYEDFTSNPPPRRNRPKIWV